MDELWHKFLAVAETGSFTAAAAGLNTSQPAVSMAIKRLERHLGVTLFTRGRRLRLTREGQIALEYARRLRLAERNLNDALAAQSGSAKLRLGLIDSAAETLIANGGLPEAAAIVVDNSSRLKQQILVDELDLAIATMPPRPVSSPLKVRPLGGERFALVCSPRLYAGCRTGVKSGVIGNLLAYDKGSSTFAWLERYLAGKAISWQVKLYSTSPDLMLALALQGRGAAFLPLNKVKSALESGRLKRITQIDFVRPLAAIYLQGKRLLPEAETVAGRISDGCLSLNLE